MEADQRGPHPADLPDAAPADMAEDGRRVRPMVGSEKELLEAFLDFQRDTLLWKVSGLAEEQLRKPWTPSGMSLLGLVKHLAYVERNWFQNRFLNRELPIPWTGGDPGGDFRIEPGETADSIVAFYRAEVAEARRIVAEVDSLETIARHPKRPHSLRRILIHMIEETARHNGHADLMREFTDGQTGE
jgi:uncharacterized damage-inducible protein DinB